MVLRHNSIARILSVHCQPNFHYLKRIKEGKERTLKSARKHWIYQAICQCNVKFHRVMRIARAIVYIINFNLCSLRTQSGTEYDLHDTLFWGSTRNNVWNRTASVQIDPKELREPPSISEDSAKSWNVNWFSDVPINSKVTNNSNSQLERYWASSAWIRCFMMLGRWKPIRHEEKKENHVVWQSRTFRFININFQRVGICLMQSARKKRNLRRQSSCAVVFWWNSVHAFKTGSEAMSRAVHEEYDPIEQRLNYF